MPEDSNAGSCRAITCWVLGKNNAIIEAKVIMPNHFLWSKSNGLESEIINIECSIWSAVDVFSALKNTQAIITQNKVNRWDRTVLIRLKILELGLFD